MSRSYRKPYSTWVGVKCSQKSDKKQAARGIRRAQNNALRICQDYEELFLPHQFECSWNNTYFWKHDGKQRLQFPPKYGNWFLCHAKWSCFTDEEVIQRSIEDYERSLKYWLWLGRK